MPVDHATLASTVGQYADALGKSLDTAGGFVEFFRSLGSPTATARRLRRRAGRLWRMANRVQGRGNFDRANDLRARAAEAWLDAQLLVPVDAGAAVVLDRGAA